ncbi:MAG: RagB/SusD family nutrient uptake outer membrane protein [Bacteroidales bacterium]
MIKQLFLSLTLIYLLTGCDVLNVEPEDSIPAASAFKDKTGIERGILGSYSDFQSLSYYGRAFLVFSDLAADNLIHPPDATNSDFAEIDNNALLPENSAVWNFWSAAYSGINTANNVIVKVPEMTDMSDEEKNAALGELYFIRALNHFNLMNIFGPVPLKTKPTVGAKNLDAARNTVAEVYKQIIDDLSFAEQHLGNSSTKIRATKFAATALLARVYLYKGDYDLAWEKADTVIKAGGYTLLDDYSSIFSNDGSAETIFEIDFTELDRNRIAEYNFPKSLNGRREVAPAPLLISAFSADDTLRKNVTIAYDGANAYANKYNDLSKGADNVIVLRLAEMYLIRAESEVRKASFDANAVQDDINEIRGRAHLPPTAATSREELLLVIENERRLEFAFEGHRWFDLVRTGRAMSVLPTVTNADKTLFPIPTQELQTNNSPGMEQNHGY